MSFSISSAIEQATYLLKPLSGIVASYYIDSIAFLKESNGDLAALSPEVLSLLQKQASTEEQLDFRGTNVTWGNLTALSPLFKQLRYLDLRNCPELQPNQWDVFRISDGREHAGFQELKRIFPCHASLTIRVHEDIEIICRYHTSYEGDVILDKAMQTMTLVTRSNLGESSTTDQRPDGFDLQLLDPYLIPPCAVHYKTLSQIHPKSRAEV